MDGDFHGYMFQLTLQKKFTVNVSINDKEIKGELPWLEAVYLWIPDAQNKQ